MAPDPPESLQQSLARLHAELAAAPRLNSASRQLLREVLADIERVLAQPAAQKPPAAAGTEGHVPRLQALAVEFEAEHPGLAGSLRQLVDLIGRAGV